MVAGGRYCCGLVGDTNVFLVANSLQDLLDKLDDLEE